VTGFKLDLGKVTRRVPVPGALRKAAGAINDAGMKFETGVDSAANPGTALKLRRCTVSCPAEITGIADLPRLSGGAGSTGGGGPGIDVTLLRLRVDRPDGKAECCVRQNVPGIIRRLLIPTARPVVLAHEEDPSIAIVDWEATGKKWKVRWSWVIEKQQYDWPGPDEWPAAGTIEVRDKGRHRKRLKEQRATWRSVGARLVDASTRGAYRDDREEWTLDLDLADGRRVTVKERMPDMAIARLTAVKEGEKRLGGTLSTMHIVARAGAPIAALQSPDGEVAVDWEATLRYPELQQPDAM
jgi:hypothetical protein